MPTMKTRIGILVEDPRAAVQGSNTVVIQPLLSLLRGAAFCHGSFHRNSGKDLRQLGTVLRPDDAELLPWVSPRQAGSLQKRAKRFGIDDRFNLPWPAVVTGPQGLKLPRVKLREGVGDLVLVLEENVVHVFEIPEDAIGLRQLLAAMAGSS